MSQQIDESKVVAGRLIRVRNTKKPKFSNQKDIYYSVWVEDANGENERCLLFTQRELKVAEARSQRNLEDVTKKKWLTNILD